MTIRTLWSEEKIGLKWLKSFLFPGVLGAALAVTMEFIHLMQLDPKSAFALLSQWGPNFFIGLLIVVILGGLLSQVVEISRDGVQAQRQMAEAITQIAQKDDRQLQELQTLAAYSAQQAERMHRRHNRTENILRLIAAKMKITPDEIAVAEGSKSDE